MTTRLEELNRGTASRTPERPVVSVTSSLGTTGGNIAEEYLLTVGPHGTTGGNIAEEYLLIDTVSDALRGALEVVQKLEWSSRGIQARVLIGILQGALSQGSLFGRDTRDAPQLHTSVSDELLLFEWVLPTFRLGFGLEDDASQSSWWLVSGESLGSINSYGYLSGIDHASLTKLIVWLTSFLIEHS